MFVEIKSDQEIFFASRCEGHALDLTTPRQVDQAFRLNLDHVQRIYVGELKPSDLSIRSKPDWTNLEGANYIGFYIPNGTEEDSFTLFFKGDAVSEFHRLKRMLDELFA